jgi:hypothetical protein
MTELFNGQKPNTHNGPCLPPLRIVLSVCLPEGDRAPAKILDSKLSRQCAEEMVVLQFRDSFFAKNTSF